jgi:hypothetical protein
VVDIQWFYEGQQVQVSDSFRYLGVWLWGPDALQQINSAAGMWDNSLQEVHSNIVLAAAWKISEKHKQTGYAERVLLGSPLSSLVQNDCLLLEPTGKSPHSPDEGSLSRLCAHGMC